MACARDLRSQFRQAHAVACLDADGVVVDMTLFTDARHNAGSALDWAECLIANKSEVEALVVLSAVTGDLGPVREHELDMLRNMRRSFGSRGVAVHDWIQTDGVTTRSLAMTQGEPMAWR